MNIPPYDELHLDMLVDELSALFVIISDTDATFNFLVAIMYSQMFNLLCTRADNSKGGRLTYHVRCLLDEFANIGEIPNFDKLIATIRSREISASIILQCIVEFIHGNGFLPACVAVSGNYGLYNWNGLDLGADIESIKMINYGDTVEY